MNEFDIKDNTGTAVIVAPRPSEHAQGKLIEMGQITSTDLDGTAHMYPMALLITFDSVDEIRKAIKDGVCDFVWP